MDDYTIRAYTSDDNAALAVMWNESDDQWPGTFTKGVPMTEERVQDWMNEETCLMRLVAENGTGSSIVAYGSLWETLGRMDSCYVELLNVHPAHQKRSLARRMLTRMVDWATERGYQRVTIGTWPANLKSVPLYKKVGFHWVPELNVFMENYIPAVRQLSCAQDFFARHNWYTTFQRELAQVEDEQRHPATGDMKVFVFRWEADGEFIEAVVDRCAQAITGINTADFAAYAVVDESEPAQGIAYPVRWQVTNRRDGPVNASILASGEEGIELDHRSSFVLGAGETRTVESTVVCAADAPRLKLDKHNRDKTAPKIKTVVVVGGETVELGTGLHYRPAVDVGIEPEFPSLLPGQAKTVYLSLRNRAGRPLEGTVRIAPQDGLETDWLSRDFQVDAGQYAGLPLQVTCRRAGAVPLVVTATFSDSGEQVTTAPKRLPLLVTPPGGVSADWDRDEARIVVENDFLRLTCQGRGGKCKVRNKAIKQGETTVREEIGPPFEPGDLHEKEYALNLESGLGWAKITLTAESARFSGLSVAREIMVTASPVVQVQHRVVNNSGTTHEVQVRPDVWFSFFDREAGLVVLPRQERLVVERATEFPAAQGDFPQKPEKMAEQWVAFGNVEQAAGVVWSKDVVEHESWWGGVMLSYTKRTIEPQTAVDVGPFYLYAGPGDWRDVRRLWQRLAGEALQYAEALPETGRPHAFGLLPSPLVTFDGRAEAELTVDNVRERPFKGHITVEPPDGWTVDRAGVDVEGVVDGKPLSEVLHLATGNGRVGAFGGRLRLEGELFDEERPFAVIRLGDATAQVAVDAHEEADQPVWTIDNGRCAWLVTPDFHGGIVSWRESGREEAKLLPNHLMTAFPDDGGLAWMKPWFGGIRPTLAIAGVERDWPGRFHEEPFVTSAVDVEDARGVAWRGVRLTAALERESFEGLRAEVEYLTVGGSNLLKTVFRVVNESSAPRRVQPGLLVFLQVDGEHRNSVLYADGLQRKPISNEVWTRVGSWGAAVNPDTGRAVVMVSGSGPTLMGLMTWGKDGGHMWLDDVLTIPPEGSRELVAYLALAESLEEAKRYAAMKQLAMSQ